MLEFITHTNLIAGLTDVFVEFQAGLPDAFVEFQSEALLLHSGMMISVTFVAISFLKTKELEFHIVEAPMILYGYSLSLFLSILFALTGNILLKLLIFLLLVFSTSVLLYLTSMIINGWLKAECLEEIKRS